MTTYKITMISKNGKEDRVYTTREEAQEAINTINTVANEAKATSIRAYTNLDYRWAGCLEEITF